MTDMRRTLLWGVFLFSLFMLYDAWLRHTGQPSLMQPKPAVTAPAPTTGASGAVPAPTAGVPLPGGSTAAPAAAPAAAASAPVASQLVTLTTDLMKATFDTRGGSLVRVELLKQVDPVDKTKNVVVMDPEHRYAAQTGLVAAAGGTALPNHNTVMTLASADTALKDGANDLVVRFESTGDAGVKLTKTYTLHRGSYLVEVKHEVQNGGSAPATPQLYLQLVRDNRAAPGESSFYFTFTGPAVYTDAHKFKKVDFKSIDKRGPSEAPDHDTRGDNGWVAMVQHYFASAWLIDRADGTKIPREFFTAKQADGSTYSVGMLVPLGTVAPGETKALDARLFVGPQEEQKLEALANATPIRAQGLELVKDYGWLTILSKPLFWLLTQFHKFFGNWGWAIVALVVTLRIAFYWLNVSAYRSMAKMKAVNPKIQELRERLKDKPQQLQQEMMRIYREEKINPLGGCLPIFVQMPFFIALYWVLLSSVEMRHAPWILWITDLSAKDPFYILPILMTLSSLLQTWLNPTPPDPVQAKMMWIMPLAFSVMFFVFPAGLVLYWLTNNVLAIAQQYLINKQLGVTK